MGKREIAEKLKFRCGAPHTFGWLKQYTYPDGSIVWEKPDGDMVHLPGKQVLYMAVEPRFPRADEVE